MKRPSLRRDSILAFIAFIVFGFLNLAKAETPRPTPAPTLAPTIDTLMNSLEKVSYSPEKVRETLKPLIQSPFKNVVVAYKKIGTGSTIQITFEMLEQKTKLADVTAPGATWATGPLLPDSGRCPINRDWSWAAQPKAQKKTLKCSAIAENCESLQTAQIEGEITCFLDRGEKK